MSCAGNPLTLPPHEPGRTSNIEHPTPNIEWQRESSLTSAFGVRCWMFDVFPRFRGSMREIFRGILSLHRMMGRECSRSRGECRRRILWTLLWQPVYLHSAAGPLGTRVRGHALNILQLARAVSNALRRDA